MNDILRAVALCLFLLAAGVVHGEQTGPVHKAENISELSPFSETRAGSDIRYLLSFLQASGMDITYGNGTIFSMVDQSLTRIISDLSTGKSEGFTDIPLIRETLLYLGISPDEIIISPDDAPQRLSAVDWYQEQYPEETGISNTSSPG